MSWQTEDGEHEGWDAAVFPDGRVSVGSGQGGTAVRYAGDRDDGQGPSEMVDGREAIGWQAICECGWRGQLWVKVATEAEQDLAAHRVWDPGPSPYADPPPALTGASHGQDATLIGRAAVIIDGGGRDALHGEWLDHLPPRELGAVADAAAAVRAAQARLDDAVRQARHRACSWADIGEATGMTRQSAHERWGKPGNRPLSEKRVSEMTDGELRDLAGAGPAGDGPGASA